jgi:hypothetical protein
MEFTVPLPLQGVSHAEGRFGAIQVVWKRADMLAGGYVEQSTRNPMTGPPPTFWGKPAGLRAIEESANREGPRRTPLSGGRGKGRCLAASYHQGLTSR